MFPLGAGGFACLPSPHSCHGQDFLPCCVRVGAGQPAAPAAGGIRCSKCRDAMANTAMAAAARSVLTVYTQLCTVLAADGAGGSPTAQENSVIPSLVFCHPRL